MIDRNLNADHRLFVLDPRADQRVLEATVADINHNYLANGWTIVMGLTLGSGGVMVVWLGKKIYDEDEPDLSDSGKEPGSPLQ